MATTMTGRSANVRTFIGRISNIIRTVQERLSSGLSPEIYQECIAMLESCSTQISRLEGTLPAEEYL